MTRNSQQRAIDEEVARTAELLRRDAERSRDVAERERDALESWRNEEEVARLQAEEARQCAEDARRAERAQDQVVLDGMKARLAALEAMVADFLRAAGTPPPS